MSFLSKDHVLLPQTTVFLRLFNLLLLQLSVLLNDMLMFHLSAKRVVPNRLVHFWLKGCCFQFKG